MCLLLFNVVAIGKKQATISEETATEMEGEGEPRIQRPMSTREPAFRSLSYADGNNTREVAMQRMSSRTNPSQLRSVDSTVESATGVAPKKGMILPFQPLAMSFDSVNYYVDMPPVSISSFDHAINGSCVPMKVN